MRLPFLGCELVDTVTETDNQDKDTETQTCDQNTQCVKRRLKVP